MNRIRFPWPALILVGLSGIWIASCSDDEVGLACAPASTRFCAGVGACDGVETCLEDGSGYGPCDCSGPPRPNGTGGSGSEPAVPTPYVGRKCSSDAECGAGLNCYEADGNEFFGGGPARGYCTIDCEENADCSAVDAESECLSGVCLRTCLSQNPSFAENKCLGRRDLACHSVAFLGQEAFSGSRQPGWCFPQCGSDDECGARSCDLARGVCTNQPRTGLPIGARCETDGQCLGNRCETFPGGESACTAPCVFGNPAGCGYGPETTPREAGCITPAVTGFTADEGRGDVGLCFELCDVTADCQQAEARGWICLPRPEAVALGRIGICATPPPVVPDAGADGGDAGDAGSDGGVVSEDPPDASDDGPGGDASTAPADASAGADGG